MAEQALLIADAVVTLINAGTWSLPVSASRVYVREEQMLLDGVLRALVFPWSLETDWGARGFTSEQHITWLVIAERLAAVDNVTVDARVQLCRQLRDALQRATLTVAGGLVTVTGVQTAELYEFDDLNRHNLFMHLFALQTRWEEP